MTISTGRLPIYERVCYIYIYTICECYDLDVPALEIVFLLVEACQEATFNLVVYVFLPLLYIWSTALALRDGYLF